MRGAYELTYLQAQLKTHRYGCGGFHDHVYFSLVEQVRLYDVLWTRKQERTLRALGFTLFMGFPSFHRTYV